MTKVKFCGIRREEDVLNVNRLLPNYIGFMFYSRSRRYVPPEEALRLKGLLDPRVVAVGVFVDEAQEKVADIVRSGTVSVVQLHGREDDAYIARLRELVDVTVIKAFGISSVDDLEKARRSTADLVLLDNGAGGTGVTFDWSLLRDIGRDFILAGGLGPDNVADAVEKVRPFAVDTSSGIETDGFKDGSKMERFMDVCRKHRNQDNYQRNSND
ncbi:MAG: phosphoribosylanthranilate isomerase [archaeon]|nr:phosphoribosylanthranilate isomerase [archaeon]